MEESTTYQEILEKGMERGMERGIERGMERGMERGRLAEAQAMLLRGGSKRFGDPTQQAELAIKAITDIRRLEELMDRLLSGTAMTWDDLLA